MCTDLWETESDDASLIFMRPQCPALACFYVPQRATVDQLFEEAAVVSSTHQHPSTTKRHLQMHHASDICTHSRGREFKDGSSVIYVCRSLLIISALELQLICEWPCAHANKRNGDLCLQSGSWGTWLTEIPSSFASLSLPVFYRHDI